MSDFIRAADRAMGLELQLEELVEQRKRAVAQGRHDDAAGLSAEIADLQNELAETAEAASTEPTVAEVGPVAHGAGHLHIDQEPT